MTTNGVFPHPAIHLDNVDVTYDGNEYILQNINLEIPRGSHIAILGPNGAGKTTLFNTILGLLPPVQGSVQVHGRPAPIMRREIAYMPQRDSIDWTFPLRAYDIALMGRVVSGGWRLFRRAKDHKAALAALDRVAMTAYKDTPIGQLSGGQQQRLIIARALAQDASIFLLDEPFNQVDIGTQYLLLDLFEELVQAGKTLLVTTHDLELAKARFPRLLFLNRSIQAFGKPEDVFTTDVLTKTYMKQVVNRGTAAPSPVHND